MDKRQIAVFNSALILKFMIAHFAYREPITPIKRPLTVFTIVIIYFTHQTNSIDWDVYCMIQFIWYSIFRKSCRELSVCVGVGSFFLSFEKCSLSSFAHMEWNSESMNVTFNATWQYINVKKIKSDVFVMLKQMDFDQNDMLGILDWCCVCYFCFSSLALYVFFFCNSFLFHFIRLCSM